MKIKTIMRCHFLPVRMAIIKKMRTMMMMWNKREFSCTVDVNTNWCSHYRKPEGGSSKNQKYNYHNSTILLLGSYLKKREAPIQKDIYTPHAYCHIIYDSQDIEALWVSLIAQLVRNSLTMKDTLFQFLGQEDLL